MMSVKKVLGLVVVLGVLGIAGIGYAIGAVSPADITASLTGKSITDVNKERAEGKSYCTIASDAGKLDEFRAQMLEQRKAALDTQVKSGNISQQQADQIYNNIKNNQTICDNPGSRKVGNACGSRMANSQGSSNGQCQGMGKEMGKCMGRACNVE